MASRWSDKPCRGYFPTDSAGNECAMCGWESDMHQITVGGNGEMADKTLTLDQKMDILMDAVATLTEYVEAVVEQQAEIVEKLQNLSLENEGFGEYQ